jgi:hypothetical protein
VFTAKIMSPTLRLACNSWSNISIIKIESGILLLYKYLESKTVLLDIRNEDSFSEDFM